MCIRRITLALGMPCVVAFVCRCDVFGPWSVFGSQAAASRFRVLIPRVCQCGFVAVSALVAAFTVRESGPFV